MAYDKAVISWRTPFSHSARVLTLTGKVAFAISSALGRWPNNEYSHEGVPGSQKPSEIATVGILGAFGRMVVLVVFTEAMASVRALVADSINGDSGSSRRSEVIVFFLMRAHLKD